MVSPSAIVLGALLAMFLVAGAVARFRSDLTRSHIPVIVLALLALTSGALITAEYRAATADAERIDYRVDSQVEGCETAAADRVSEFDELSPDAREVFLSTLRSEDGYTTTENPDQFDISSDADVDNYVRYESECYSVVGYGAGIGSGMYLFVLLFFGIPLTAVLAFLAVYSYRTDSFRTPATVVSVVSVGTAVWLRAVEGTVVPIVATVALLVVAFIWITMGPVRSAER